ncbi:MAG: hypothetical protein M3203_12575 [Actinomycetota bacterium]|nr:hypothetical protein [Actinomycetota bacterium]
MATSVSRTPHDVAGPVGGHTLALDGPGPGTQSPLETATERVALRRSRLLLVVVVLGVYLLSPNVTTTDSYLAMPAAVSLVHSGDLDLDEFSSPAVRRHYAFVPVDGRHMDRYPWAMALLFVPGVLAVDGLRHLGIGPGAVALVENNDMGVLQLVTASLVTALTVLVVAVLAHERLRGPARFRRRSAFLVGLVFGLGTAAWSTASRSLWQHGPSMLALAVALLLATRLESGARHRATAAWLGATLAAAYAVRPTNAIAIVAFTVFVGLRHRRRAAVYLGGLGAGLAVFVAVNVAAYGSILPEYFSTRRVALHPDYAQALAANLFSPARGLLVFSPVALLAVAGLVVAVRRRTVGPLDVVAAGISVSHLLIVSAQNEGWWAGHAFGARFLSDVLPLLAYLSLPAVGALLQPRPAPAPSLGRRLAAAAVWLAVVASVVINGQGAIFRASTCWNIDPVDIDDDPSRVWDLDRPQVLAGFLQGCPGQPPTKNDGPEPQQSTSRAD